MSNEFKVWISKMVQQIIFPSSKHVINNNYTITSFNQPIHKVTPNKTSSTCHHYPLPLPSYTTRYTCHYTLLFHGWFF
ncbi:hypothetical protein Lalb_Chr18g0051591 [Lupinus albus]|uniref:Uncharacterized protein n=1 Tax=Lupinus albus TaxID=3870 RepID=A0A6A4NYL0_LUPAL|nr:hypothetical protein Lalb_Chr18g0051591 [Lupinus albus]